METGQYKYQKIKGENFMRLSDLKFLKIKLKDHPTRELKMEYINKPNAIGVMVLDEKEEKTLLVDQYRPGTNSHLLEIPARLSLANSWFKSNSAASSTTLAICLSR